MPSDGEHRERRPYTQVFFVMCIVHQKQKLNMRIKAGRPRGLTCYSFLCFMKQKSSPFANGIDDYQTTYLYYCEGGSDTTCKTKYNSFHKIIHNNIDTIVIIYILTGTALDFTLESKVAHF